MFDREEQREYSFTVMAMDIGGRTGFTTLHVTVDDVNDNKPIFMQTNYKNIIRANITAGSVVLKVSNIASFIVIINTHFTLFKGGGKL